MRRSSLQFHALPQEVIDHLNEAASTFHVMGIALRPRFEMQVLGWPLQIGLPFGRLAMSTRPFDCNATLLQSFAAVNPNCLHVELPSLGENVLTETSIGYVLEDDDPIAEKAWSRVMQYFKKRLASGATAIHPITGATALLKTHRYSAGALQAQADGVSIRPSAGNAVMRLGPA